MSTGGDVTIPFRRLFCLDNLRDAPYVAVTDAVAVAVAVLPVAAVR